MPVVGVLAARDNEAVRLVLGRRCREPELVESFIYKKLYNKISSKKWKLNFTVSYNKISSKKWKIKLYSEWKIKIYSKKWKMCKLSLSDKDVQMFCVSNLDFK